MAEREDVPDFSSLPDVAWVLVMKRLSLRDRVQVAYTCHALYDVFKHPSLWSNQSLLFIGNDDNFTRNRPPVFVAPHYVGMIMHFGHYIQYLTVKVNGHFQSMSKELKEILTQVAEKCRLEVLTLDIGKLTSGFHTRYGFPPDSEAVKVLVAFVRNAFRMKRLHIRSWPMYKKSIMLNDDCNVFKALTLNQKLTANLEALTLFWPAETGWTQREPLLLRPETTLEILQNFKNLTTLGLRSPMVSTELLELLANPSRAKLDILKIAIHYLDPYRRPEFKIPNVPSRIWKSLLNRNPNFKVECLVLFATPNLELANLLTPEVPVSDFRYMQYSQVEKLTVSKLKSQYSSTLTGFRSYCDSEGLDQTLLHLCQQCENLTELVYHGQIYTDTVVVLAKTKGLMWKLFEMSSRHIKCRSEFDDIDEDNVLHRNADGELVQVDFHRFHAANNEDQVNAMVDEVSVALGKPWKPRSVN